jgi:hypothetical protein
MIITIIIVCSNASIVTIPVLMWPAIYYNIRRFRRTMDYWSGKRRLDGKVNEDKIIARPQPPPRRAPYVPPLRIPIRPALPVKPLTSYSHFNPEPIESSIRLRDILQRLNLRMDEDFKENPPEQDRFKRKQAAFS